MSDKDKLSFAEGDEEEFHITDEDIDRELAAMETEQPSASSSDAASTTVSEGALKKRFAALKQLKRKHWIIIAVIGIILFFGLIKMLGNRSSPAAFDQIVPVQASKVEPVAPKKADIDLTQKTLESNPLPDLTLSSAPSAAANVVTNHDTLKTDLSTIANNETKLTEALTSISAQNQALTQKLSELSSRVGSLESVMNDPKLIGQGASSQTAVTSTPKVMPPSPLSQQAQMQNLPDVPEYTVEAVVPQRAWIQAADGSTMTVTIGESLPGLGAVVSIDPYSGNVTTASGTVVKYGS